MSMSQESYNKELQRQIDNCYAEMVALQGDYHSCSDDICKSQIRTLLEKKEHNYIDLLRRRYDGSC